MTDKIPPKERAQKLFDEWYDKPAMFHELVDMIAAAIAEAEKAVREVCCKAICEHCANDLPLEWLNDAWWHIGTIPCKAIAILAKDGTGE